MLAKHSPGQFDSPREGMLSAQDDGLYRNGVTRFKEPLSSQQKIAVPARPRYVSQLPVAQRKQVLTRNKPPLEVIAHHDGEAGVQVRWSIQKNDTNAAVA